MTALESPTTHGPFMLIPAVTLTITTPRPALVTITTEPQVFDLRLTQEYDDIEKLRERCHRLQSLVTEYERELGL